jgi:hypothetical protein
MKIHAALRHFIFSINNMNSTKKKSYSDEYLLRIIPICVLKAKNPALGWVLNSMQSLTINALL